jgi:hypothetical protein
LIKICEFKDKISGLFRLILGDVFTKNMPKWFRRYFFQKNAPKRRKFAQSGHTVHHWPLFSLFEWVSLVSHLRTIHTYIHRLGRSDRIKK